MHVTSSLQSFKIAKKAFLSSLIGSFIWLVCLPTVSFSASLENGKQAYQQKCLACHTIGGGRLVGPDLKGVTSKREPSWLERWIIEPDKMLAEGDSLATQLLQEYNNVPMPNLGVSQTEAKDIIAYIAAQSSGGAAQSSAGPAAVPTTTEQGVKTTLPSISALSLSAGSPEKGKEIYQKICFACHTIGSGKVGPDLKGATSRREPSWLVRWITEPRKMLAEGDSDATLLRQKHGDFPMPNYGLSEAQAIDIIAYIAAESGDELSMPPATTGGKPEEKTPSVAQPAPAGDIETGRALFVGQQSFANGAPACIACHSTSEVGGLGGGSLGPDLTKVNSKFGAITPGLVNASFPTMKGVFSKKPILDAEAAHLKAYFSETDSLEPKPSMDFTISLISIIGFIILYILTHLIWRKRLTGVRIPLVGR